MSWRFVDIVDALEEFTDKIWYGRHQLSQEKLERGEIQLVERESLPIADHSHRPIQCDIWQGALKAARRVEKKYGVDNLGPWTDLEWGMLNGKLSALRGLFGDEWDFLDT